MNLSSHPSLVPRSPASYPGPSFIPRPPASSYQGSQPSLVPRSSASLPVSYLGSHCPRAFMLLALIIPSSQLPAFVYKPCTQLLVLRAYLTSCYPGSRPNLVPGLSHLQYHTQDLDPKPFIHIQASYTHLTWYPDFSSPQLQI